MAIRRGRLVAEDDTPLERSAWSSSSYRRLIEVTSAHNQKVAIATALFPLLFVAGMAVGKIATPRLYRYVTAEDSAVEYATFLIYIIASFLAIRLVIDLRKKYSKLYLISYSILAAGLFVIGMEEISWGQRIFNIETPSSLKTHNYKGELNIHNIKSFPLHNAYIGVGLYGAFARLLIPRSIKNRRRMLVDLFTPPYFLCLYFFIPAVLYIHYQYLYYGFLAPLGLSWTEFYGELYTESFITGRDQEPIELLLALGFLLFVAINRYRYNPG